MLNHILVPMDGSTLAECVLPHVQALGLAMNSHITLLHVLEKERERSGALAVDPLEWRLKKREAESYLNKIQVRLKKTGLNVEALILEGTPAECIIDFAASHNINLIALSTHGRSGLSGWNVSSVVQKIILRAYKSIMLVRAHKLSEAETTDTSFHHRRLFVGLDRSAQAEYVLPTAISLAQFYKAELILGAVIQRPEIIQRMPLSREDAELLDQVAEKNHQAAAHYFEQLQSQLSLQNVEFKTRLVICKKVTTTLHDMVEKEKTDLVMLTAHGHGCDERYPYGSVATSFIAYGNTPLIIMQDLASDQVQSTQAELASRESKGH